MNSNASCKLTPVKKSEHMIRFVLDDLSTSYSHEGGGGISEIKQIATNTFRVSIAQEERIDQITYELELNEACEVKILNKEITAVSPWETS